MKIETFLVCGMAGLFLCGGLILMSLGRTPCSEPAPVIADSNAGSSYLDLSPAIVPRALLAVEASSDIVIRLADDRIIRLKLSPKLDIEGDPNLYTEAARVFLTSAIWDASYTLVSEDPNALRRLCKSGRVCAVRGHAWQESGRCSICCAARTTKQ